MSWIDEATFLDTEKGLEYCGDESLYLEIIQTYVEEDKIADCEKFFNEKDWDNYRILVHGVKSSSLYIGAVEMSETAKALEFACKDGNFDYVLENHAAGMAQYRELLDNLKTLY